MTYSPPTIVVRESTVRTTPTGRGPYVQSSHAWRRDGERRPRQLGHIVAGICSALRSPYPASDGPRVNGASRHHATIGHSAVSARCILLPELRGCTNQATCAPWTARSSSPDCGEGGSLTGPMLSTDAALSSEAGLLRRFVGFPGLAPEAGLGADSSRLGVASGLGEPSGVMPFSRPATPSGEAESGWDGPALTGGVGAVASFCAVFSALPQARAPDVRRANLP